MASWGDWKNEKNLEATLKSLEPINLKHEEIFGLVCPDFPDFECSCGTLDHRFLHIEIFHIN